MIDIYIKNVTSCLLKFLYKFSCEKSCDAWKKCSFLFIIFIESIHLFIKTLKLDFSI